MMSPSAHSGDREFTRIAALLKAQRQAFLADGVPDLAIRVDRLNRLARLLLDHHEEIVATESEDFGGRAPTLTRAADILGGVGVVMFNRDNLASWMSPQSVDLPPDAMAAGMRAEVHYQPLGVVGVITPWNGPFLLATIAAANILAAGNRLMLKPSELAPASAALLSRLFARYFDPAEAVVVEGDAGVSQAFARQPFDHLLFTGSTRVGREVMKAAAENLTPVTLELGGKCPVIIGKGVDEAVMAARLSYSKLMFGGQVCVTPDYVLVPKGQARRIAEAVLAAARQQYPTVAGNKDYTAIINDRHVSRLQGLLEDARQKGAEIMSAAAPSPLPANDRRLPLSVVLGATEEMGVMQEEIFGPILPVLEYDHIGAAIAFINRRDRPLAAYYFGADADELKQVQAKVWTGSMVVNDALCQIFYETLPFGGVGPSGMGRYRGFEGFKTFSNQRPVVFQSNADEALAAQRPPYAAGMETYLLNAINGLKAAFASADDK